MRDDFLGIITHLKIALTQTGGTVKNAALNAAADMKVGAAVAAGTTASGVWTSKDIVTYVGLILSVCLIVKYIVDIKKSLFEMTIMKIKEEERLNRNSHPEN